MVEAGRLPGSQQILPEAAVGLVEAPGGAVAAVTLEEELVASSTGGPGSVGEIWAKLGKITSINWVDRGMT